MSISNLTDLNNAIIQANNDAPNPTLINFDNALTIDTPGAINDINAPITFNCNDSQINGNGSNFILFKIKNSVYNVYINDLNINMNGGGRAFFIEDSNDVYFNNVSISNCSSSGEGGAILFNRSGIFELNNCKLSNNISQLLTGGCIRFINSVELRMNQCSLSSNMCAGFGGAIHCSNNCEINNCIFDGNTALNGGACRFDGGDLRLIRLTNCQLINNVSNQNGGGIHTISPITIDNCIITNNTATVSGGGIYNSITKRNIIIINSTIDSNSANDGGGYYNNGSSAIIQNTTLSNNTANNNGGGYYSNFGVANIQNTTLSGNISNNNGGGTYINSCTNLQMVNSTVSGNISNNNGSGIYFVGIQFPKQLANVTVANNTSNNNANAGVYCDTNQIATLDNTIVANNNSTSLNRDVFGDFTGSKNNLIGTVGSAIGFNPIDGNLIGVNPMLGPLDYNGGPTQTMALLPGSPAIDSGDSSLVPIGTLYDQRGPPFNRFSGTSVDIGAFEFNNMVICVSGDSIVYAKHIITNVIQHVHIKDIVPCDYHVYNTAIKDFVPIKLNIVTGKVDRFILLKKDVLGTNEPNQDLYITSGHMLLIDGKEIKARDVKQGKIVKIRPQLVHSICTQIRCPILINGLSVMSWGIDQWLSYAKSNGISWYDNK